MLSLGLLAWHWNSWRQSDHGGLPEREQLFYRRQFRRRVLASGMLGVIGLLMTASLWIQETSAQLTFWLGILFALLWVILLAITDWWASRTHFGRDQVLQTVERELLKAEIRKYQLEQQNKQNEKL
jgi:hypothetical protein